MTYEEAFKIGSVAEGTILATCAEFWDTDGRKLFSFQRANSSVIIEDTPDIPKVVVDGKELAIVSFANSFKLVDFNKLSLNDTKAMAIKGEAQLDIDFPIVRAAYYTEPKNGKVPVYLLPDAIDELRRRVLHKERYYYVDVTYYRVENGNWLSAPKKITERLYEGRTYKSQKVFSKKAQEGTVWADILEFDLGRVAWFAWGKPKRISSGSRTYKEFCKIFDTGNYEEALKYLVSQKWKYLETAKNDQGELLFPYINFGGFFTEGEKEGYSEKYQIVNEKLKRGSVFMVKTAAFDWFATNIDNATIATTDANGKTINLPVADYLAQAKAKMDRAKTLIAAAGAATIL